MAVCNASVPKRLLGPIYLNNYFLEPPHPSVFQLSFRETPFGCRTIFVKIFPGKITEQIATEVFVICGEIVNIRMFPQNFCHVRFASEESVNKALRLYGYKIKLFNDEKMFEIGRLHIFGIESMEDRRRYQQQTKLNKPSIQEHISRQHVIYSDHEAFILDQKLKNREAILESLRILQIWLETGQCNDKNVRLFYSMLQNLNNYAQYLVNEFVVDLLNKCKKELNINENILNVSLQLRDVKKIFTLVGSLDVWSSLEVSQQKYIEQLQKEVDKISNVDSEISQNCEVLHNLRKEHDDLSNLVLSTEKQLAALRLDANEEKIRNQEIIGSSKQDKCVGTVSIESGESEFSTHHHEDIKSEDKEYPARCANDETKLLKPTGVFSCSVPIPSDSGLSNEKQCRLVALLSIFLQSRPSGANLQAIDFFFRQIDGTFSSKDIIATLEKYPSVFKKNPSTMGWTYCADMPQG